MLRVLQKEIAADALRGGEKPARMQPGVAGHGAQSAPEREIMFGPVGVAAAELDPRVAGAVGVTSHEQIPLDAFRGIAIGFDARRGDFAVEEKGKLQWEDAGFAAPVVAAQKQAAFLLMKFLVIVAIEIEDMRSRPREKNSPAVSPRPPGHRLSAPRW